MSETLSGAEKLQGKKLGQLASTAICGNDITSSCLYVSALALIYGGRWGPVALLCVAVVLYLFRSIYGEVVGALPLNGVVPTTRFSIPPRSSEPRSPLA